MLSKPKLIVLQKPLGERTIWFEHLYNNWIWFILMHLGEHIRFFSLSNHYFFSSILWKSYSFIYFYICKKNFSLLFIRWWESFYLNLRLVDKNWSSKSPEKHYLFLFTLYFTQTIIKKTIPDIHRIENSEINNTIS